MTICRWFLLLLIQAGGRWLGGQLIGGCWGETALIPPTVSGQAPLCGFQPLSVAVCLWGTGAVLSSIRPRGER